MVVSRLSPIIIVPEFPKVQWNVQWGVPIDYQMVKHEYLLTNVKYKGIRYYMHSKLDAAKSKILQKAYMDAKYEEWNNEFGMVK